jgi:signal transduction histidine kinase
LALAKEITDHMGGEIRVDSRPEAGSTFSLLLPLAHTPRNPGDPRPSDT